jgi:hypothetical protein
MSDNVNIGYGQKALSDNVVGTSSLALGAMCSFDGSVPKILTWEDYQKHFKQLKTNIK